MAPNTRPSLNPDEVDDLIYACRTGDLEDLKTLLKAQSQNLNLSEAAIITSAIDIDSDGLGSRASLLHYPSANGNLEIVSFLLEQLGPTEREFVNHQNVNGNTPLHWAALNGHIEIVKALVKAGADPTVVNEAGRDAVVEAEYSSRDGAADCAHWLLKECDALEKGMGGPQQDGEHVPGEPSENGEEIEGSSGMQTVEEVGGSATNGVLSGHDQRNGEK